MNSIVVGAPILGLSSLKYYKKEKCLICLVDKGNTLYLLGRTMDRNN